MISTLPCIFILPFSSELVFNYIFPRLDNLSLNAIIQDPSSQARLALVSGYFESISSNPLLLFSGFGTGSLPVFFNTPHFEGLFVTVLAELGLIGLIYLVFIIRFLFFPAVNRSSSNLFELTTLSFAFFPFVVVSFFASLTLFSSLLYPSLMILSYSAHYGTK